MADPVTYRPKPGEIPTSPGVYRFRDEHGRVIYVGKAKNLRQRLANYFQDVVHLHERTQRMVTTAASVEWTVVGTEVEALALEFTWIQQYDPRFNVKYRDDKSYPYLAVTLGEEVPRAQVMRGAKRKGTRYFGPYGHAWAIRETLDLLLRVFPIRTCSAGVYKRAGQSGRPCLLGYIDKCSAPCVGRISVDDHRALVLDFCDFMAGDTAKFERRLTKRMQEAAAEMEYEQAARLRDDIEALRRATEKNAVVLGDATDADVFALVGDELEAAVQVFHVRGGRIRGQRGWVVEKVEDITDGELVEHLLQQVYGSAEEVDGIEARDAVPREVLVPVLPPDLDQVGAWLSGLRGARVDVRVPQRGDKRELAATVRKNAEHALMLHRTRRAGDLTTRSQALARDPGGARPGVGAPAHRVLRHLAHAGHLPVGVDGCLRGRAGPQERVPLVQHPGIGRRRRPRRHAGHARGHHAPLQALPQRPAQGQRRGDAARRDRARSPPTRRRRRRGSPTRRASWWSTAGHPRSPPQRRRWTSSASPTSRSAAWPSAWRRCGCRARTTRSSCSAPARACTCSSASATRRTGSPSRSTAGGAARA